MQLIDNEIFDYIDSPFVEDIWFRDDLDSYFAEGSSSGKLIKKIFVFNYRINNHLESKPSINYKVNNHLESKPSIVYEHNSLIEPLVRIIFRGIDEE